LGNPVGSDVLARALEYWRLVDPHLGAHLQAPDAEVEVAQNRLDGLSASAVANPLVT
jgi:hypothetical protein